jgi:hypothetical protein
MLTKVRFKEIEFFGLKKYVCFLKYCKLCQCCTTIQYCTLHSALYSAQCTALCTVHSAQCTLQCLAIPNVQPNFVKKNILLLSKYSLDMTNTVFQTFSTFQTQYILRFLIRQGALRNTRGFAKH